MVVEWNFNYYLAALAICLLSITCGNGERSTAESSMHQLIEIEDLLKTNLENRDSQKFNVLISIKKYIKYYGNAFLDVKN